MEVPPTREALEKKTRKNTKTTSHATSLARLDTILTSTKRILSWEDEKHEGFDYDDNDDEDEFGDRTFFLITTTVNVLQTRGLLTNIWYWCKSDEEKSSTTLVLDMLGMAT